MIEQSIMKQMLKEFSDLFIPYVLPVFKSKICLFHYGFSSSHVWMWELERSLRAEEFMLSNCGAGEDAWESPGQQGSQS